MLSLLIIIFNTLIAGIAFYNFYYKRRKLPPGPTPLPVVGNLPSVYFDQPGEDCYVRWSREYGPVYTFWLGELPIVFVTDFSLITEYFQKDTDTFIYRFTFKEFVKLIRGEDQGVVMTDGDLWRDHRRFALQVFRDFGVGKNLMEDKIITEIAARFIKLDVKIKGGVEEFNIADVLDMSIGSIINALLFNYRFDDDKEEEFFELKHLVSDLLKNNGQPMFHVLSWKPSFFRHLPGFKRAFLDALRYDTALVDFFRLRIEEHENRLNLDSDEPPQDYVEAYLREKAKRDRLSMDHTFTMSQLVGMCFDLWMAGQETTSTSLAWGVAHILHRPEVQERMHKELDAVIGTPDRFVTMADRPKLPYICAVVNETQRVVNLVSINVLRRATRDVNVNGYHIPKDTCIIPQISAVLYDDNVFPDAKAFKPERFLTEDDQLKRCDELIPFSVGKRACLGEPLARMEMFLFMANIFNRYKILPYQQLPSMKRAVGGVVSCPPYTCKMELRT